MARAKISSHQVVTWTAIFGLLILRLFIEGWILYKNPTNSAWVEPVEEIGTYILIAFLIGWEWKDLKEYYLTPLSVLILIVFPALSKLIVLSFDPNNEMAFPKLLSFPFFIIAGILIYLVIRKKTDFRVGLGKDLIWFAVCAVLGLLYSGLETFFMIKFLGFPRNTYFPGYVALASPFYQLGFAACSEEPLFRGFLWGALRKLHINEIWILLIQALLFAFGHIFYLNSTGGLLFVGMIFISALIMGLLVWRSRSLSSSMAFHAFANGSTFFLYWVEMLMK
jgi:CAAX amino terminal protease family.